MDMWHVVSVMWTKTAESTRNHRWLTPPRKLAVARVHRRPGHLRARTRELRGWKAPLASTCAPRRPSHGRRLAAVFRAEIDRGRGARREFFLHELRQANGVWSVACASRDDDPVR